MNAAAPADMTALVVTLVQLAAERVIRGGGYVNYGKTLLEFSTGLSRAK